MKRIFTALCLVLVLGMKAQVFTGTVGAIQNNGQETFFTTNVSGLAAPIDSMYGLEQVCFSISDRKSVV